MTAYKNLDNRLDYFVNNNCQYIIGPYDHKQRRCTASAHFSIIDLNKEFSSNVQLELDQLNEKGSMISPLPKIRADLYEFSIGEEEDAYDLKHAFDVCQKHFFQFLKNALLTDLNDRLLKIEGEF